MSELLEQLSGAERRAECRRNDPAPALPMRIVIIYGHQQTAVAAFRRVTELTRTRPQRDVALIYTVDMNADLAASLRRDGAELWYCGPDLMQRAGEGSHEHADRRLVAASWNELAEKCHRAMAGLLEGVPA